MFFSIKLVEMNNLILIYESNFKYHDYYKDSFEKLVEKWISVFVFVKNWDEKILWKNIFQIGYLDKNDLVEKIKENNLKNSYFNTFEEYSIWLISEIKKYFWQSFTENYKAFTNKDLQRKLLLEYDKSITVNFIETTLDNLAEKQIENFWFPFVIKPSWGAQSRWVKIINTQEDFEKCIKEYKQILWKINNSWYNAKKLLIEEFIDWQAWSVDYFVDEKQNIYLTKPVFLEFGIDIWLDDFCNISRKIVWYQDDYKIEELNLEKLKEFVEKNVKAIWIKNTFVHHEFKFTSKWLFKTIELNWRIWWFRLQMIDKAYWLNLLELPFWGFNPWYIWWSLKTNYAVFVLFPVKKWILKWFNEKIEDKIKNLKSLEKYRLVKSKIWKEVWPAKLGYSQVWTIRLNNKNLEEFEKDYEFLRKNYEKLLEIENK